MAAHLFVTREDLIQSNLRRSAPLSDAAIVQELIESHKSSPEYRWMIDGDRYFNCDHNILSHNFKSWKDPRSKITEDLPNKADNRIAHPYHRRQVLEKSGYLYKNPIKITHKSEEKVAENFRLAAGRKFDPLMMTLSEEASNQGRTYLHFFFDGEIFDYLEMDAREVIPIFETSRNREIESLIRFFNMETNMAGDVATMIRAEWWFNDRLEIYEQQQGSEMKLVRKTGHFKAHIVDKESPEGRTVEEGWGRVPFVEFKNNRKCTSDLIPIKAFLDALDMVDSQFANDLIELQDAILKATATDSKPADLAYNMKFFKVVTTSEEESDMDWMTLDMPFEAKSGWIKDAEESIAAQGMSIFPKTDRFGSDPSGVALTWLYTPLDTKASMQHTQFVESLRQTAWFFEKSLNLIGEGGSENPDEKILNELSFEADKTIITNLDSKIKLSNESFGKIPDNIRFRHDPRVKAEELEQAVEDMKNLADEKSARDQEVSKAGIQPTNGAVKPAPVI